MVRAGKFGEYEDQNQEKSIVSIDWEIPENLSNVADRVALQSIISAAHAEDSPNTIRNWVGQIWAFVRTMAIGDLVAMPLKGSPAIMVGRICGDYEYDETLTPPHIRKIRWLSEIPRSLIEQDLLYSLGAIMTVCRIQRNGAEARFIAMLAAPLDLGSVDRPRADNVQPKAALNPTNESIADENIAVDLEELARDAIRQQISRRFSGHALAGLVEAVLNAQGYKTLLSPPGPDGGVDVLAGRGAHGFDEPKLAVQVKSGSIEVDTSISREFRGVMEHFGATQGLIVSWGGFRNPVRREAPRQFFKIRMWDADDLIAEILANYDKLPPSIQASLPLKQVWMLVGGVNE